MLKLQIKIYIFYINIKCKYLDIALLKKKSFNSIYYQSYNYNIIITNQINRYF